MVYHGVQVYPVVVKDHLTTQELLEACRTAVAAKLAASDEAAATAPPLPGIENCRLREYDTVRSLPLSPIEDGVINEVIPMVGAMQP